MRGYRKQTILLITTVLIMLSAIPMASRGQTPNTILNNYITAGWYHTVGLRSDGTVVAVGLNADGQLNVSGWRDIVAIAAGAQHTVGLRSDGIVVAVGSNTYGQLNVSSWRNIVAIAAGGYHTVGLKSDGTVMAVGSNADGRLNVSSWRDIVAIAAGGYHTVGLKSDGTVMAVGDNTNGQLNVSGWRDIVAIAAGGVHTVGLKPDGTVVAVGNNTRKQLNVSSWNDIVIIAAGGNYTVGLKQGGAVVAAGEWYDDRDQPIIGGYKIVAIAVGNGHILGLKADGAIVTLGSNSQGQINLSSWKLIAEYAVSGRVTDNSGNGISGVLVKAGSRSVLTGMSGTYELTGLGGSQSIVPVKEGYAFNPSQKTISGPEKDVDFRGGYVASGKVVDVDGVGIEAVTVSAGDNKTGTTKDGSFKLEGLSSSVRLTASKEGYSFAPVETVLTGPATKLSFTALYEIKGYIRDEEGNELEGIEVLAGDKKAITDAAGAFKLIGLSGVKEVIPKKEGAQFDPASVEVSKPEPDLRILGILPPPAVIYSTSTAYKMERLTRDGAPKAYPRLSPDGKMLAYNEATVTKTGTLEWSIYAITLGQQGRLTVSGRTGTIQPSWMPTSDRIVYSHLTLREKPVLVRQSCKGGMVSYISNYPIGEFDQYPDVDSSGNKIVFQTVSQGKNLIHVMQTDGTGLVMVTEGSQPCWKPNSDIIVYSHRIGKHQQVMIYDKGEIGQLTQGEYDNLFPCWSPDGEWIAFISNMDGRWHLYIIRTDGTKLTQLTKGDSEAFYCDWGSDGWLYFVSNAGAPASKIRDPWTWPYSDVWRLQPVLPK